MLWQRDGTHRVRSRALLLPSNLEPVRLEAKLPVLTFACKMALPSQWQIHS